MITHNIKAAHVSSTPIAPAPSAGIPVAAKQNVFPPIRLACVEVCNFRRLACTRLDLDVGTTVLVGANNSGKTSLLTVLRNFLGDAPGFRPYDLSLSQWTKLRELSKAWEDLAEDPTTDIKDADHAQECLLTNDGTSGAHQAKELLHDDWEEVDQRSNRA